ncbi:hypothetical protein K2X33_16650 [bacterium]|nr:hypothetical protein [bacterium]
MLILALALQALISAHAVERVQIAVRHGESTRTQMAYLEREAPGQPWTLSQQRGGQPAYRRVLDTTVSSEIDRFRAGTGVWQTLAFNGRHPVGTHPVHKPTGSVPLELRLAAGPEKKFESIVGYFEPGERSPGFSDSPEARANGAVPATIVRFRGGVAQTNQVRFTSPFSLPLRGPDGKTVYQSVLITAVQDGVATVVTPALLKQAVYLDQRDVRSDEVPVERLLNSQSVGYDPVDHDVNQTLELLNANLSRAPTTESVRSTLQNKDAMSGYDSAKLEMLLKRLAATPAAPTPVPQRRYDAPALHVPSSLGPGCIQTFMRFE